MAQMNQTKKEIDAYLNPILIIIVGFLLSAMGGYMMTKINKIEEKVDKLLVASAIYEEKIKQLEKNHAGGNLPPYDQTPALVANGGVYVVSERKRK